jgi:DNA-binding IclR family transcriptional regulator
MAKQTSKKSALITQAADTESSGGSLYATPALDKGLDILELLAGQRDGLTKSEIARALNRTVSEIFRMLVTLERRAYISMATGDRYVLSLRLFQLVQEHPPTERLLAEAIPRMQALAAKVQQSCHLGVLEGARAVILAQANTSSSIGFYVKPGSTIDLTEAATGQVILAFLPDEAQKHILDEWKKRTSKSVPADLKLELQKIRKSGYEKRASYQVRGVINVSFPILDAKNHAVAALTVPCIQRVHEEIPMKEVEQQVGETARAISAAIGAT